MTRNEVLGPWAVLPRGLIASRRRRRLLLVGASAPGVLMAVLGVQLRQDPRWLGAGLLLLFAVFIARHLSEPRFLAWDAAELANATPSEDPKP